ncbi:MAG: ATP-dependent DNA helicase RecQ [Bdellovibrionaceae bacterium]|nr:ATP-dependent DNA helicase RecQ [Pseudobdellovibrionaceae bacterium]
MTLEQELQRIFKLSDFRTGQRDIINAVLAKKDALAVLPTGGGKSLCYQFPVIYQNKLGIVISPLIALMKDQVLNLRKKEIPAGCLHSGQTEDEKRQIFSDINKGGAYLLYLSPERVQKEGFQKWIMQKDIALFAVDEAHCVSQWGHDFRSEYAELKILKTLRPDIPILALTASATPTVLDDIAKNLQLVKPERMVHGFYRPNLYYQVETCTNDNEKMGWLLQALKQFPEGRVLIYCGTRKVTEQLSGELSSHLPQVGHYHAGLSTKERTETQESYARGDLRILVATNAFGMGIDQPDVRLVVHYQMPANIDSLYQEMGRAGRDEKDSSCLMLYSKKDKGLQSYFIQNSTASGPIKSLKWKNLDALVAYSETSECRHAEILTYYKDSQRLKKCGHCDSCDPASPRKIQEMTITRSIKSTFSSLVKKTKQNLDNTFLTPEQEERFQNLRRWRKEKANELDVPAFVILGDKSLRDLAQKNPTNLDDLRKVYGIGEAKAEKFGWDILAELRH